MKSIIIIQLIALGMLCGGCATTPSDSDENLIREHQQSQQDAVAKSYSGLDIYGAIFIAFWEFLTPGNYHWLGMNNHLAKPVDSNPMPTAATAQPIESSMNMQERLVGSWWFDNYGGPSSCVTFSPDGLCTLLSTNSPRAKRLYAYWRVEKDGILLITKTKDALPDNNMEIFILDHMTDKEMVFGHPSVAGRMTFRK